MKKLILILFLACGSLITNAKETNIYNPTSLKSFNYDIRSCTVEVTVYIFNEYGELLFTFSSEVTFTSDSPFACDFARKEAERVVMEEIGYLTD